ncbi:hypothetical protein HPB47_024878 [Ixodes persulcatus]|uniref:Uncharacterized protein n=1 Tax=Ixodes persulcatus TaxID=34615 RepID=A0AC60Q386_IXOPE|nr:hypothetical protein HPB47_024878 [Ixodes persulcatus]
MAAAHERPCTSSVLAGRTRKGSRQDEEAAAARTIRRRAHQQLAKVCLLLATLHMLCLLGVSSELSDFVTKYERVRMHSFTVPATKGVDSMSVKQESQGGYRVSFEAYGQKFNLSLAEDRGT